MASDLSFDWLDYDADMKRIFRALKPTFIVAPRELSQARLTQLLKTYLPKGNVLIGIAREHYVLGFENQPQFKVLTESDVEYLAGKVATSGSPHLLYILTYSQREEVDVLRAVKPKHAVVVRGSYQYVFHRRPLYHVLNEKRIPFDLVTPFRDEAEAKTYLAHVAPQLPKIKLIPGGETDMLELAHKAAANSFDYSLQVGCVVAAKKISRYHPLVAADNSVVPYQTYALHAGNSREEHLSEAHDSNYYDTIHAEMKALIQLSDMGETLRGKTLFLTMLPCPNCARTLSQAGPKEIVYGLDHSDGYAVQLLEQCGVKMRKVAA